MLETVLAPVDRVVRAVLTVLTVLLGPVDRVVRVVLTALLAIMVLCVTWQIVSRYALGDPSSWTEELARFLLIWIGLIGGAFAYHRRLHLGFDMLSARLRGRARTAHVALVHGLVALFAVAVLIVGGGQLVRLTFELEQRSPALGVPMGFVYAGVPLSGVLLLLYAAAALFNEAPGSGSAGS